MVNDIETKGIRLVIINNNKNRKKFLVESIKGLYLSEKNMYYEFI